MQLSQITGIVQANSVPRPKNPAKFSINNLISISEYASQGNILSESYSALIWLGEKAASLIGTTISITSERIQSRYYYTSYIEPILIREEIKIVLRK